MAGVAGKGQFVKLSTVFGSGEVLYTIKREVWWVWGCWLKTILQSGLNWLIDGGSCREGPVYETFN